MILSAQLAEAGPRLAERVLDTMYADPFWAARFGDRGRRHARTDGDFHMKYLAEALDSNSVAMFENYARWLRELLVSRGMCSRHLAENFTLLAEAIDSEPWDDRARAVEILRAGAAALRHTTGPAAEIEMLRGGEPVTDTLLSYLADALAFEQPSWFAGYTAFATTLRPNLGAELAALRRRLATELANPVLALAALDNAVATLPAAGNR